MEPVKIFYCYAPQDKKLRDKLETHLMALKRLKQITLRLNREIVAGTDWSHVQDGRFQMADLILLLVSPDFIASDYHYGIEMHHALEKHEAGNVWVIPIILRPTSLWQETPLGKLQVLPNDRKPITEWANRDTAFVDVVKGISEVVAKLLTRKQELTFSTKVDGKLPKFTQVIGPLCSSCRARNPVGIITCENCGDLLLSNIVSISPLEWFCDNCGATNIATARFCQYCATPLPFKDIIGSSPEQALLSGRYQLEKRIGQGGSNTSTVYKAVDTRFNNRPIAIKEMNYVGSTPTLVQKAEESFKREARLLADLLHPNLPRIYDHFTENERSYLVMDFIEGQTLKDYLEKAAGSSLPLEQVLDWGIQICDVLNYLHTHQPPIILRDLKPSNVMISESGHVYLISFGIARITQSNSLYDLVKLNPSGYTAPELSDTSRSTPRSDIYSLGALLHCLLTGIDPSEQPFFFRPASQLNPAVPQELEDLLQQALEMDSVKRPASVQDIVKVLRHIDQQRISDTLVFATVSDKTIRSAPKGNQLLQNAYALYAQKRGREALDAYDQALKTESLNPLAWQGRGLSLVLNARHREALDSFERALQLDSSLVASLNGKGTALNLLHRNREALDAFDKAVLLEPDNAALWNGKGAVLSALGQPDQALTAFDIALHFDGRMEQAWNNKGLVLRQMKRYPEALRAFEQALSFDRNNVAYWNGKGLVLYEMGRLDESLRAYQEVIDRNPNYAFALYGIGNVLYAQQKLKSALDHYDRAVKVDPNFVKAWDRRGNVLGEMADAPRALESYEKALGIDPRYAPAWNGKASVLSQMGRYDLALDAYEHALRLNPNFPQAWNGKGNAYYQLGDYTHSLESYERALRLNPRLDSALHNKSLALKQLGRYKESLDAAETAIGLTPNDPDNWQRKAEALRKLRRGKEARAAEAEVARLRISGEL